MPNGHNKKLNNKAANQGPAPKPKANAVKAEAKAVAKRAGDKHKPKPLVAATSGPAAADAEAQATAALSLEVKAIAVAAFDEKQLWQMARAGKKCTRHASGLHAKFRCTGPYCRGQWSSHDAVLRIQINTLSVTIFHQKCKRCDERAVPKYILNEQFTIAVQRALQHFVASQERGGIVRADATAHLPSKSPHNTRLCEACGFGDRKLH